MCLSNFKAIRQSKLPISRLRDFMRSYDKTSYGILKWGPGFQWSCMNVLSKLGECAFNSFSPSDCMIKNQRTGSTLVQVMVAWGHQAITLTNVDCCITYNLQTYFSEILLKHSKLSFKKIPSKILSTKCQPFGSGLIVCIYGKSPLALIYTWFQQSDRECCNYRQLQIDIHVVTQKV